MDRRRWTALLTGCALLAQALGGAWAAPPPPAAHGHGGAPPSMPCHPLDAAEAAPAPAADTTACCCDENTCTCAAVCGAVLGLAALGPGLEGRLLTAGVPNGQPAHAGPAHRLTPLRPPITSLS